MEKISGIDVHTHEKSKRILNIRINDEIIEKLIFPFNKFDLTALELKPFTRFTLAKSFDDLTENKLSKLMNAIIKDRSMGCLIIGPKKVSSKINDLLSNELCRSCTLCSQCSAEMQDLFRNHGEIQSDLPRKNFPGPFTYRLSGVLFEIFLKISVQTNDKFPGHVKHSFEGVKDCYNQTKWCSKTFCTKP